MRPFANLLVFLIGILPMMAQPSMDELMSYPFPSSLTAAKNTNRIAWLFNERGQRNVYVAEGPNFEARRITNYTLDDGQEISSLSISDDGAWLVYLRGGEHGSNWDDEVTMNPLSMPFPDTVQIWSVPFEGGDPLLIGKGASPVISPTGEEVAFVRGDQIWTVPIDTSEKAQQIMSLRGSNGGPTYAPDGSKIAFVSRRGDHSYIGIYEGPEKRIKWLDPGFDRDYSPRWSPDGAKIAFIRRPGSGGAPETILENHHAPWSIVVYDLATDATKALWTAPETLRGSVPRTHGGTNLNWAAGDRLVFLSYHDGWPHLYSLLASGGDPLLLTQGDFMCEYISVSVDGESVVFSGNSGPDALDIDRRHIGKVSVHRQDMQFITPGDGNEWAPKVLNDGTVVMISATAQRPPLPAYLKGGDVQLIGEDLLGDYPSSELVTPRQVVFDAPDGLPIHATLFEKDGGPAKKPAIIYIHGGPPRQMLLGWHYSSYYSNAYATNQYLANQGFIVISVNYRLGIGYGYEFHYPPNAGWRGASEYQDIKAAGEWLAQQSKVDPNRIGVYGGSYGGYLTAMALAKDSDLFAAGVDIHGVHDRTVNRVRNITNPNAYEKVPDADIAPEVMWKSSPVAYVDQWTSPVLIIHGDDDRNVPFSQSVDLVQRLRKQGVEMETLVIVDDSHHFMVFDNQKTVNEAATEFLIRKLGE